MTKRYFKVEAKCGHVGHGKCIWITFAIAADNGKEAARKVRDFKRVKHDHKDAIGSVKEISFEEFIAIKAANDADPYLHCKNIQEQRKIPDFDKRVVEDKRKPFHQRKKDTTLRRKLIELNIYEADLVLKNYLKVGEYA